MAKILIAEDDRPLRNNIKALLENSGGFELLEKLKQKSLYPKLPLIFISAFPVWN